MGLSGLSIVLSLLHANAASQAHDLKPADALAQLAFLRGSWVGEQSFNTGGKPLNMKAKDVIAAAIGGRYLEEKLSTIRPDGTASDTRHFLTYLPNKGKFHAWWFNDSSAGAMELEGVIEQGKLVLQSVPGEPGSPPANTFRATYFSTGSRAIGWSLELKHGNEWQKLFTTLYRQAGE